MLIQPSDTEDKSTDNEKTDCFNLKDLSSIITSTENMIDLAIKVDTILIRSLKFKNDCENACKVIKICIKNICDVFQFFQNVTPNFK